MEVASKRRMNDRTPEAATVSIISSRNNPSMIVEDDRMTTTESRDAAEKKSIKGDARNNDNGRFVIKEEAFTFLKANEHKFRAVIEKEILYIVSRDILSLLQISNKSKYTKHFLEIDKNTLVVTTYFEEEELLIVPADTIISFLGDIAARSTVKSKTKKLAKKMILCIQTFMTNETIETIVEENPQEQKVELPNEPQQQPEYLSAFPYHIGEVILVSISKIEPSFVLAATEDAHSAMCIIRKQELCFDQSILPSDLFHTGQSVLAEITSFNYEENMIELSTKEYFDIESNNNSELTNDEPNNYVEVSEEQNNTTLSPSIPTADTSAVPDKTYEKEINNLSTYISAEIGDLHPTEAFKETLAELVKENGMFLVINQVNQSKKTFKVDKSLIFINALSCQLKESK